MTLKFVIILQNLIKAYHTQSGNSKYDRKLTELDVEMCLTYFLFQIQSMHLTTFICSKIALTLWYCSMFCKNISGGKIHVLRSVLTITYCTYTNKIIH